MAMISIDVPEGTALAYQAATADERRKYELLLSLRLQRLVSQQPLCLSEIMNEASAEAESAGLTEEELERLLHA